MEGALREMGEQAAGATLVWVTGSGENSTAQPSPEELEHIVSRLREKQVSHTQPPPCSYSCEAPAWIGDVFFWRLYILVCPHCSCRLKFYTEHILHPTTSSLSSV